MKVRILTLLASPLGSFLPGQEVELGAEVAAEWIRIGHAEPLGAKAPQPELALAGAGETAALRVGGRRR